MRLTIKNRELEIQGNSNRADTIMPAAFRRCSKQSYAPAIATGHHRTGRVCFSARGAPLSLLFFHCKCCRSRKNEWSLYRVSATLTHTFIISILLPCGFPQTHQWSGGQTRIVSYYRTFGPQVSQSASWHARSYFYCESISYTYFTVLDLLLIPVSQLKSQQRDRGGEQFFVIFFSFLGTNWWDTETIRFSACLCFFLLVESTGRQETRATLPASAGTLR